MTDHIKRQVGLKIKHFRELKGMSQAELARWADSEAAYISKVETGKAGPTVPWLMKIAQALGVKPKELFPDE